MTFVGKILVIVILAFSLFFLALSTVVMTASTNWRQEYETLEAKNQDLQQQVEDANNQLATREAELKQQIEAREDEIQTLQGQVTSLNNEIESLEQETTSLRAQVESSQQTSQTLAQEAEARAQEAEDLREQFLAAQQQANDYAQQQTELNEQIFQLERQLATAQSNNEDLRNALADYQTFLESRGLPSDRTQVRMAAGEAVVSPDIEGRVLRIGQRNELVEISVGSDDGVVKGQTYFVYRAGDNPQYIGEIRITQTEPDKAVAQVINRYLGRKVREGDDVAAQIRPRS